MTKSTSILFEIGDQAVYLGPVQLLVLTGVTLASIAGAYAFDRYFFDAIAAMKRRFRREA